MPNPYASATEVSVDKTKGQIEKLLLDFGATALMNAMGNGQAMLAFEMQGRRIKFVLPLPQPDQFRTTVKFEQATRTRWRALYLALRAKLEMASVGITTFEAEFLANIVMPNGRTVYEETRPVIASSYEGGHMPPLLEGPR